MKPTEIAYRDYVFDLSRYKDIPDVIVVCTDFHGDVYLFDRKPITCIQNKKVMFGKYETSEIKYKKRLLFKWYERYTDWMISTRYYANTNQGWKEITETEYEILV